MLKKIGYAVVVCFATLAIESNCYPIKDARGHSSSEKGSVITAVCHHENAIEDRLVLKFSGEPDCCYVPTKEVALNNNQPVVNENGMKQLEYFFRMPRVANFESLAKSATISRDNYSVTMGYNKLKKGVDITICFDDRSIGFQYEKFRAITSSPGISFTFIKRDCLAALNNNSNHLFNTAFCSKKKMI